MCIKLRKVIKCINQRAGEEIKGLKSLWEFFVGGGGWSGSVAYIIEHECTLHEKSCILEMEN